MADDLKTRGWHAQTAVISAVLPLIAIIAVLQLLSDYWFNQRSGLSPSKPRPKITTLSIYSLYFWSIVCSISCLLVHLNPQFLPHWYCHNLMYICFIFKSTAESCLYLFYLQRAKLSQGCLKLFPSWLFRYGIPVWIVGWLLTTIVVVSIFFRGGEVDTSLPYHTGCLFDKRVPWFMTLIGIVDAVNSLGFLYLFYRPWKISINMSESDFTVIAKAEFREIMFHHVTLTAFTTITTFVFLVLVGAYGPMKHFTWMAANIDLVCQCFATFSMLASNRAFIKIVLCKDKSRLTKQQSMTSVQSSKSGRTKSITSMTELQQKPMKRDEISPSPQSVEP